MIFISPLLVLLITFMNLLSLHFFAEMVCLRRRLTTSRAGLPPRRCWTSTAPKSLSAPSTSKCTNDECYYTCKLCLWYIWESIVPSFVLVMGLGGQIQIPIFNRSIVNIILHCFPPSLLQAYRVLSGRAQRGCQEHALPTRRGLPQGTAETGRRRQEERG